MRTDASAVARRLYTIMGAVVCGGAVAAFLFSGTPGLFGFLVGSVISFANAWWMHRIAMSIGADGRKPGGAPLFAVFRYFVMLALLYGILMYSEPGFLAALAGCFVHIVAVVLEVVYELTYGTTP
jgi:hypothetical protein